MLNNLSILLAALFSVGAFRLYLLHDFDQARLNAKIIAAVSLAISSVVSLWLHISAKNGLPIMQFIPATLCLVALAITSFAPVANHAPKTFARIFLLFSIAQLFFVFSNLWIQVMCCIATTCIVWWEVSTTSKSNQHRAFLMYQGLSCLLLIVGVGLIETPIGHTVGVFCVVFAIMIRQGILPFHSWFVGFVQHAPIGIVLAFSIPQLMLFLNWTVLVREADFTAISVLSTSGALTAMLAALLSLAQTNVRRVLGYLMLSQSGFLCFAFTGQSSIALQGAFLWWLNSAIALTGFALVLAAVESRRGMLEVRRANGNFAHTPKLAISFLLFGFAFAGFPSSLGYIAEDLLIQGSITQHPFLAVLLVLATAFNGFNVMRMFMMLFTGKKQPRSEPDLLRRETLAASLMLVPIFVLGLIPSLVPQASIERANAAQVEPIQTTLATLESK